MNKLILTISFIFFVFLINGQTEEKILFNKGIEAFNNKEYAKALDYFKAGYAKNGNYSAALFNSANTAFLNDSINTAKDLFSEYVSVVDDKINKSKGYYNLGNVQYKEYEKTIEDPYKTKEALKALKESIDSYKNALRNNPKDSDARHNLSLAMSKVPPPNEDKEDQNGENKEDNQGEDNENKEDQNKDDQQQKDGNQDKDGEKGDEKKDGNGGNPDEEKKGEEGKEDQQSGKGKEGEQQKKEEEIKGQISRMQATKDLDAMNNDEQKILMKVNRKKGTENKQNSSSKDW